MNMDDAPVAVRTPAQHKVAQLKAAEDGHTDISQSLCKLTRVEAYAARDTTDPDIQSMSMWHFNAHYFVSGGRMRPVKRPKIIMLKPFLNLDSQRPDAAKMARMALRLLRPFSSLGEDPWHLTNGEALDALEEFVASPMCPRWVKARYATQNRARTRHQPRSDRKPWAERHGNLGDGTTPGSASGPSSSSAPPSGTAGSLAPTEAEWAALHEHGLLWERAEGTSAWTVPESIAKSRNRPAAACVNGLIELLRGPGEMKGKAVARLGVLVRAVLAIDLIPWNPKGKSVAKQGLLAGDVRMAAKLWLQAHPHLREQKHPDVQAMAHNQPHLPVAWNALKRQILSACGLHVVQSSSHRIYFDAPHHRPRGPHAEEGTGQWRQPVVAFNPYAPEPEEEGGQSGNARARAFVRQAHFEQSMGSVVDRTMEVPVPEDPGAILSPDKTTKSEWDAVHPYADFVRPEPLGVEADQLAARLLSSPDALTWVKPERCGGATPEAYASALLQHPQPPRSEKPVVLAQLDPTQRCVVDLGARWATLAMGTSGYESGALPAAPMHLLLLGTAGTGETTALKVLLDQWSAMGFGRVQVAAYTGVAASNIGLGARTLSDLFRLSKVNEASQTLKPITGDDLSAFLKEMHGLRVLIIDEVSMVSRVVLAQVNQRLQEWRQQAGANSHAPDMSGDAAPITCDTPDGPSWKKPFGGIAVVLAGDFGQLPPVGVSKAWSLLNTRSVHYGPEAAQANVGARLFRGFTTVVRLRRIHRQKGASDYKDPLLRARDGAMTKEDHARWATHDLTGDACTLTTEESRKLEEDVPHLFMENTHCGERNGRMCGRKAEQTSGSILRIAAVDSHPAAARQSADGFANLRAVIHLTAGAPVMLLSNLRTPAGLVNGAVGTLVAVLLKPTAGDRATDIPAAVWATDIEYAVVGFPTYEGPVIFSEHPTWVPIEPLPQHHKRFRAFERIQLPLSLAWGMTVHKSQGLTLRTGAVVDFSHSPSYEPVARMGLPFVGLSRTVSFSLQGFKKLPDFWAFREVLEDQLFKWRKFMEVRFDTLHDTTMAEYHGHEWTVDDDVAAHKAFSEKITKTPMSPEELTDLRSMLSVRGLLPAPEYDDAPQPGARGLRGGGGRSKATGMRPSAAQRRGTPPVPPTDAATDVPGADIAAEIEGEASDDGHDASSLLSVPPDNAGRVGGPLLSEMASAPESDGWLPTRRAHASSQRLVAALGRPADTAASASSASADRVAIHADAVSEMPADLRRRSKRGDRDIEVRP